MLRLDPEILAQTDMGGKIDRSVVQQAWARGLCGFLAQQRGGHAGTGWVIKGYFARGSLGNCLPYGGALTSDALTSIAALTVST